MEARRWRLAQAFEAATWRQLGSKGADRDETHLRRYPCVNQAQIDFGPRRKLYFWLRRRPQFVFPLRTGQYDSYTMIFPRRFERALEIGCGPWTQSRALLAATAIENDLFLVTRNVKDTRNSGAALFNPWEDGPADFSVT